ncbi:MAG: hypothetical protein KDJ73_02605 [Notoacmeibacter sp.]|nr:hypothetical protein [Notoacmeibacter sp.]MCC0031862.1 hypothetical protein [Brucellaceae bacterium]
MKSVARLATVVACLLPLASGPGSAWAQSDSFQAPQVKLPGLRAFTGQQPSQPEKSTSGRLTLKAHLVEGSEPVSRGMIWRVFRPVATEDGKLPLAATAQGGTANLELEPGSYLIHAAFGRAGATKRITIEANETRVEDFVLDAGGLELNAVLPGGVLIPAGKLRFSIYDVREDENGERALILPNVKPGTVVRLNAGTYHVVSTYGAVNAVIRSDIRVEAGKLTEAVVEHRAAQLTMKLVREAGGEAIADTAWVIMTEAGDIIRENVGAFASMVLAEGKYSVVAKNRDRIYQREFDVIAGKNQDVEVMATE